MVMPYSALRTGQHLKWRSGNYKRKAGRNSPSIGLNLRAHEPWDLDNIEPDFFPMPGSVVFAEYTGASQGKPLAPGTVQMWRGNWQENYAEISRKSEPLHQHDGSFKSPYAKLSSQGPTIVDRRLFFVETIPNKAEIPDLNVINVQPRLGNKDNKLYEEQLKKLEGVVSNDHLFDVYLGECIAPYVALTPLQAVLPVHKSTMIMPLNHDECEEDRHHHCRIETSNLHSTMQRRWKNAAAMFHQAHQSQKITDLYKNLNHLSKLSSQLEYLRHAITGSDTEGVVYSSAGEATAAIIRDNHAIADYKTFQTICHSKDEAYYVLAIINSNTFAKAAEPFMSRGLYGARDLQKHGWKLPIPRYDTSHPLHVQLSELGKLAEEECKTIIDDNNILIKTPGKTQSEPARTLLRQMWQFDSKTAQNIEAAVAKLLSDPAQAALAELQMTDSKSSLNSIEILEDP